MNAADSVPPSQCGLCEPIVTETAAGNLFRLEFTLAHRPDCPNHPDAPPAR